MRHIGVILALLPAAAAAAEAPGDALGVLVDLVGDPVRSGPALAALRASKDKDLAPVFVALSRSGDKRMRLFAVASLPDVCGPGAAPALAERLAKDPMMTIRAEALVRLMAMEAATPPQLAAALRVGDEKVRCLAARGLVACGRGAEAAGVLRELAQSNDPGTSAAARVALLAAGDAGQAAALKKLVADDSTPDEVLLVILSQVASEKVTAAIELVGQVAWSSRGEALRVRAFKTLSALSPKAGAVLVGAIESSTHTVFRVYLLEALSSRGDAAVHLARLARVEGTIGVLARMELARVDRGAKAARAVSAAFELRHPVVLDYLIARARKDIAADGREGDFYTPALLAFIRSVNPTPARMRADHFRAAQSASLLLDLGTPAAMAGLREILAGRHNAIRRAVGAGMLRSDNRVACELARGLLGSPYEEMANDAALTLGRFNDPAGKGPLGAIVAHPKRHRPELVALAAWYLLRNEGRSRTAARTLAGKIK